MSDDLERRAGKGPDDDRPEMRGGADDPDPSDYSDPRVTQPGEDPPGEDALPSGGRTDEPGRPGRDDPS